ncbi:MAG: DUF4019 domain-containing protein [Sphingomonadaceae bacterium]|nr:DUF4019 domain-containing protein [Sphingomonadaceae bacterium]
MPHGYGALTEKEKQTLRLIVRGHDAKSIARHFDLSVHTVNERLRDVRRKLSVSSSREAARLLLAEEGQTPDSLGDKQLREAAKHEHVEQETKLGSVGGRTYRFAQIGIGAAVMSLALGLLALMALPQMATAPTATSLATIDSPAAGETADAAVEAFAQSWLALVDQGRWDESWRETTASFRKLNTSKVWASTSEEGRVPLGAVLSRTLTSHDNVPAPPHGYDVLKFRTSFANKPGATETISLMREGGGWRVVGYIIS